MNFQNLSKKYNYFFYICLFYILLLTPPKAKAFLPPDLITQSISSLSSIIGSVIIFISLPLIGILRLISIFKTKINKKTLVLIFFINLVLAIVASLIFYFFFYLPKYKKSPIFNDKKIYDRSIEYFDPRKLNNNYVVINELLRDKNDIIQDKEFGLNMTDIKEFSKWYKIYYVDVREPEEFLVGHIKGAKHIRHADILNENTLKSLLNLGDDEYKHALIILYCHNGDRAFYTAKTLNKPQQIKYLIGGFENLDKKEVEIEGSQFADSILFGSKYQFKYLIDKEKFKQILDSNECFVVDFRKGSDFANGHLKGSLHFLFNTMPTPEYQKRLNLILKNKDKEILIIANRYTELFYVHLLIKRLTEQHGFNINQFHILFNQFENLAKDKDLKIEFGYPDIQ